MDKKLLFRLAEGYVRNVKRGVRLETELGKFGIEAYDYANPLEVAVEEVLDGVYIGLTEMLSNYAHNDYLNIGGERFYTIAEIFEKVEEMGVIE